MLIKPNSQLLAALTVVLSNLVLLRELNRYGLRLALVRVFKSARMFVHPRTWISSFTVLKVLTASETQPVLRANPRLVLKFFDGDYLGTNLSLSERASILIDHYTFLKDRVERRSSRSRHGFFRTVVDGRIKLWERVVNNRHYCICVTFPRTTHREGDLSLIFQSDDVDIYTLSFTIGPGSVAGLTADHVIYIGLIQGKYGGLQLIRNATKDCLDISPAALLLAATDGVAQALELSHIIGIGADAQLTAHYPLPPKGLVHAYDEFWIASGGIRRVPHMYHLSVPLPEKPIQAIKINHRSRTLHKRAFKKLVKEQVCRAFGEDALRPGDFWPIALGN